MSNLALITGSYGGLGSCFAQIHASIGGDLILVGKDSTKLATQKQFLCKKYNKINVYTISADLSDKEQVTEVYRNCLQNNLKPDILINNAGFGGQGCFVSRDKEEDMKMIEVNICALTLLCKLFLPDFVERGSGHVLNVSSIASLIPGPLQTCYFATKAYVSSFSNGIWQELKGSGVTLTCLMPGVMETGFISRGNLTNTKLFSYKSADPMKVAQEGYKAMLKGKMNIISGPTALEKLLMIFSPLLPKRPVLTIVEKLQARKDH